MPGVPEDSIKVFKDSRSKEVRFEGRAPMLWTNIESSCRVYSGCVFFDKDPNTIEIDYKMVNGCFRMWFTAFCEAELCVPDSEIDDQQYEQDDDNSCYFLINFYNRKD
jgi:hypothetical protein